MPRPLILLLIRLALILAAVWADAIFSHMIIPLVAMLLTGSFKVYGHGRRALIQGPIHTVIGFAFSVYLASLVRFDEEEIFFGMMALIPAFFIAVLTMGTTRVWLRLVLGVPLSVGITFLGFWVLRAALETQAGISFLITLCAFPPLLVDAVADHLLPPNVPAATAPASE